MFNKTARFYDALYSWKDYRGEIEKLLAIIDRHVPKAGSLLDVACGTGKHLELLRDRFDVEGVDLDPELLDIARARNRGLSLHLADMRELDLGRTFDVVMCLFSSIGYVGTKTGLERATAALAAHVAPGGVLLIEPWFSPQTFQPEGHIGWLAVDEPDLKIVRADLPREEDGVSIIDFHYLIATHDGIDYVTERHELGLFTPQQHRAAITAAGLELREEDEFMGRGLYVATRPR
ncbi:MAG TPA: class I SAM-dependent methyltransferase [Actinomycetota bacterium]|nr:class I SAM-dependent methyltransferase [Actinomycetota bacterium]